MIRRAAILLGLLSVLPPAPAAAAEPLGVVVVLDGDAERHGRSGGGLLAAGDPVFVGDTVMTGQQGRLRLLLADRAVVTVGPGAELVVLGTPALGSTPERVMVKVKRGMVWARVSSALAPATLFAVETQNTTVAVRGTSFFVDTGAAGTATALTVARGKVALSDLSGRTTVLGARERAVVGQSAGTVVSKVSREALAAMRRAVNPRPMTAESAGLRNLRERMPARVEASATLAGGGPSPAGTLRELVLSRTIDQAPTPTVPVAPPPADTVVHGHVVPGTPTPVSP